MMRQQRRNPKKGKNMNKLRVREVLEYLDTIPPVEDSGEPPPPVVDSRIRNYFQRYTTWAEGVCAEHLGIWRCLTTLTGGTAITACELERVVRHIKEAVETPPDTLPYILPKRHTAVTLGEAYKLASAMFEIVEDGGLLWALVPPFVLPLGDGLEITYFRPMNLGEDKEDLAYWQGQEEAPFPSLQILLPFQSPDYGVRSMGSCNTYPHPHVSHDGTLCPGGADGVILEHLRNGNILGYLHAVLEVLHTYNPRSPYESLHNRLRVDPPYYAECGSCGAEIVDEEDANWVSGDGPYCDECVVTDIDGEWQLPENCIYSEYHRHYLHEGRAITAYDNNRDEHIVDADSDVYVCSSNGENLLVDDAVYSEGLEDWFLRGECTKDCRGDWYPTEQIEEFCHKCAHCGAWTPRDDSGGCDNCGEEEKSDEDE